MKKSLEYITGLSTSELNKMVTIGKAGHSKEEIEVARQELKLRGATTQGVYSLDSDMTTKDYMMGQMSGDFVVPTNNDNNPIAMRHMMTTDLDTTTFVMWIQSFVPILVGAMVGSGLLASLGIGFINKYVLLIVLDAVLGIIDMIILYKHKYDIKKLLFWGVWLPPVYMKLRMRLLGEKNFQHIVWLLSLVVFLIF